MERGGIAALCFFQAHSASKSSQMSALPASLLDTVATTPRSTWLGACSNYLQASALGTFVSETTSFLF